MAWKVTPILEKRLRFVKRAVAKDASFVSLCEEFGISPRHGRKWLERFLAEGIPGLQDRPRRPKSNCRSTSADIVLEIIKIRNAMNWGCGQNLHRVLAKRYPAEELPSPRTIDRILKKAGYVKPHKKRHVKPPQRIITPIEAEAPNDVWTTDFKGWWFTQDRRKCQPFTLRDQRARYLLAVQGMPTIRWAAVKEVMSDVFRTYGLPLSIRSDNGSPFACTHSLAGLTKLSAWWVALGIYVDRIEPGHPEQNGGHERMHKDLKRQLQRFPELDLVSQQAAFDEWRRHFNEVRPHSGIGMQTPAEAYVSSSRKYPGDELEVQYPPQFEQYKVSSSGYIKRRGCRLYVTQALAGWHVGLEHEEDGSVYLWFAELCLGQSDKTLSFLKPMN